jgi:hypothetical protein
VAEMSPLWIIWRGEPHHTCLGEENDPLRDFTQNRVNECNRDFTTVTSVPMFGAPDDTLDHGFVTSEAPGASVKA